MPTHPAHKPAYFYGLYRRHRDTYRPVTEGPRLGSSGVLTMMEHSGTHIDALCHQACDLKMFGDVQSTRSSRRAVSRRSGSRRCRRSSAAGAARRRRLEEVPRLPPNTSISAEDLKAAPTRRRVRVNSGDVLLVRTGYGACWNDESIYMTCAGVAKSGTLWAADHGVVAVGADNLAWDTIGERDPDTGSTLFAHVHLLQRSGIYIMENMNLEALSAAKAYVFAFVGIPLKLRGATGSPIRPVALSFPDGCFGFGLRASGSG